MSLKHFFFILLIAVLFTPTVLAVNTTIFQRDFNGYDGVIDTFTSATQQGTNTKISIKGDPTNPERILIRYDINVIPSDATIVSADLNLYAYFIQGTRHDMNVFDLNRFSEEWIETQATLTVYKTDSNWTGTAAEGDYNITSMDYIDVNVSGGEFHWNVKNAVEKHLVDGNVTLLLRLNQEVSSSDRINIYSSNIIAGGLAVVRPRLIIEWEEGGAEVVTIDVNVSQVEGYDQAGAFPIFSYIEDSNLTIDFNAFGDVNNLVADINYSLSTTQGTGSVIVSDLNLSNGQGNCSDLNFQDTSTCSWDWNIFGVSDANYYILINLRDGVNNSFDASDASLRVDNNAPILSNDANALWQNFDANVHISWTDAGSGLLAIYYALDTDSTSSVVLGARQTYDTNILVTADGNWAIDYNAVDNKSNVSDTNRIFILIDKTKPSTSWDGNISWQNFDANIHLTCSDGLSGCLSTAYRLDLDSSSTTSMDSWQAYDANILVNNDGNWRIDFNSTDNAGNVGDINTFYVLVDKTVPSTSWDGNNYVWQNFDANIHLTCTDANSGCNITRYRIDTDSSAGNSMGAWQTYDTNILITADGNWQIDFNSMDNANNIETTNSFFVQIDKTNPNTVADYNANWQAIDANVTFTCADANSGCGNTAFRIDSDSSNGTAMGSWIVGTASDLNAYFNSDGNWAVDFNSTDTAGNIEDSNRIFVLIDKTAPILSNFVPSSPVENTPSSYVFQVDVTDATSGVGTCNAKEFRNGLVQAISLNIAVAGGTCSYTATGINVGDIVLVDWNASDNAGNFAADENSSTYTRIAVAAQPVSVTVLKIDSYLDNASLPVFSYIKDANLTIDFNVLSDINAIVVDINYSSSNLQGTGNIIVADLNLSANGQSFCDDLNFQNTTRCLWDWNIHSSLVIDGNYFINIFARDGNTTDFNASNNSAQVDNNAPYLHSLVPAADANVTVKTVSFTVVDSNSDINRNSIVVQYNFTDSNIFNQASHCSAIARGLNCSYTESNIIDGNNTITVNFSDIADNTIPSYYRTDFNYSTPSVSAASDLIILYVPKTSIETYIFGAISIIALGIAIASRRKSKK